MTIQIQIYTMQSVAEAQAVAALGVQHVGLTPGRYGLPGEISFEDAAAIVQAMHGLAATVALSVDSDVQAIVRMAQAVRPDILHLCGLRGALSPQAVADVRRRLPGLPVMQAISVAAEGDSASETGAAIEQAVTDARAYAAVADYLILDTQAPDIAGIGASGRAHDWRISRAIVEQSPIPVILAGGLGPDNVAAAIRAVRPWGVDSLTRTNHPLVDGGFCKDLAKTAEFVAQAMAA